MSKNEETVEVNEEVETSDSTEKEQFDAEQTLEEVLEEKDESSNTSDETIESVEHQDAKDNEIEQLQAKLEEVENKHLRLLADYENFKRRAKLDKEAIQKYRAQSLLTDLIPVLDNFERALEVEAKEEEAISMMEGMQMIYRSLADALKSEGLVEIEAQEQPFDPNFHQAVMTDQDESQPSGIVLEELQKGYILKDRVLRPSMVKVND